MRKEIPLAVFIALGLQACNNPARPTANPDPSATATRGAPTPLSVNIDVASTPTANPDYRPDLSTQTVRDAVMLATARAVATKGPEGLVKDGFPEKILHAQKFINTIFLSNDAVKGVSKLEGHISGMGSTVVNLSGSEFGERFLFVSAGHGVSPDYMGSEIKASIETELNTKEVTVSDVELRRIGIEGLMFDRSQFGLNFKFITDVENGGTVSDDSFIVVDKASFPDAIRLQLEKDAISLDDLSFDPPSTNEDYFGSCTPENTSPLPVAVEAAKYEGMYGNLAIIGPAVLEGGCSGTGAADRLKLMGIIDATKFSDAYLNHKALVYPLSEIGPENFRTAVYGAISDLNSQK